MDFKALSRTAEADVLAFASAAPRKLVQSRMVSVGLTANHRFCAAHLRARAVSSGKAIAGETFHRLNGMEIFQPGQVSLEETCPKVLVLRILEGVNGLCPPITRREGPEESSVGSELLVSDGVEGKALCAAHLVSSVVRNPSNPFCLMPHPTAAPADGERQPQLQSHAINPAAGR